MSKAKHFCNLCKVWCQGDPVSIKRHEAGLGHKNKVAHRLKAKRRGTPSAADPDVVRQVASIEAAAAASMRATAASGQFAGAVDVDVRSLGSGSSSVWREPGGGHRRGEGRYEGDPTADFYEQFDARSFRAPAAAPEEREEEDQGGEYVARGVRYLQGLAFADKFRTGSACETWDEAEERWRPAVVRLVKRYSSASGEERLFDIELNDKPETIDEGKSRVERHIRGARDALLRDVKAKDIRVVADAVQPEPRRPPPRPREALDENTGMGKWTTVAVRAVPEPAQPKKEDAASRRREDRESRRRQDAADRAKAMCDLEESRDALNSHISLFGATDVYRGVQLADEEPLAEAPTEEKTSVAPAVFKKRKVTAAFRQKKATSEPKSLVS